MTNDEIHPLQDLRSSYEGLLNSSVGCEYEREEERRLPSSNCTLQALLKWIRGPTRPRVYHIQSSEWLDLACSRLLDKFLPSKWIKISTLVVLYIVWSMTLLLPLRTPATEMNGGEDFNGQVIRLDCTARLWYVTHCLKRSIAN